MLIHSYSVSNAIDGMQKQWQSQKMGSKAKEAVITALVLSSNNLNMNFML